MRPMVLDQGVLKAKPIQGRMTIGGAKKNTAPALNKLRRIMKTGAPRLLISRALGGFGDVLMTTPSLKALKYEWPASHLTYATDFQYGGGVLKDILMHNPYIDELVAYQTVGNREFDIAADITSVSLTLEHAAMGKPGGVPNRIDIFANAIGVSLEETGYLPIYKVLPEETSWAKKKLQRMGIRKGQTVIGVQVSASTDTRNWPIPKMKEFVCTLAQDPRFKVVVFASSYSPHPDENWNYANVEVIKDVNIRLTAALINEAGIIVAPDSGLLHLAGALNKKIVGIFGPTDPAARINHYPNATAVFSSKFKCMPCVTGESRVLTDLGYKQIKHIKVGDRVKTADSSYQTVSRIHRNKRDNRQLIEIIPSGSNQSICVTEDHKMLVSPGHDKYFCPKNYSPIPEWVPARDIRVGDFLCIPRNKATYKRKGRVSQKTKDLFWLYGVYMAEGDVRWAKTPTARQYRIRLTLNADETEFIEQIRRVAQRTLKSKIHIEDKRPKENTKVVYIHNKEFAEQIIMLFGRHKNATTKKIPSMIPQARTVEIEAFLQGYFRGDGYRETIEGTITGRQVYSTSSPEIAYGIQELYSRLGIFIKVYKRIRDTNFKKRAVIYRLYWQKNVRKTNKNQARYTVDDRYIYTPVRECKISGRKDPWVYDITVENNPTFTVNNFATYDCWYRPTVCNSGHLCLVQLDVQEVYDAVVNKIHEPLKTVSEWTAETENSATFYSLPSGGTNKQALGIQRDLGGVGDIICTTCAVRDLKERNPDRDIVVAVPTKFQDIFKYNPDVLRCVEPHVMFHEDVSEIFNLSSVDALSEVKQLRDKGKISTTRPEVYVRSVGGDPKVTKTLSPVLYVSEEEEKWARKRYTTKTKKDPKTYILTLLKTAEKYRDWRSEHYIELFKLAGKKYKDWRFIVADGKRSEIEFPDNVLDATGFDLRRLFALAKTTDYVLTPDTALLHIAAAFEKPCVTLFGPLDPEARCKHYKNIYMVRAKNFKCMPCWRNANKRCTYKGAMKGGYSACLDAISATHVLNVLEDIMGKKEGG